jgi:hypothetical protein
MGWAGIVRHSSTPVVLDDFLSQRSQLRANVKSNDFAVDILSTSPWLCITHGAKWSTQTYRGGNTAFSGVLFRFGSNAKRAIKRIITFAAEHHGSLGGIGAVADSDDPISATSLLLFAYSGMGM